MQIELKDLLAGKATRIKNNDYFPTAAYVEPFLERMQKFTSDFRVQVRLPDQVTKTKDGNIDLEDITYNRVWIQAVLPEEYAFDNHRESVSLLYALDTRKPIVKIFKNALNMACLNMCVFNPEFIQVSLLEPESPINYGFVDQVMQITDKTKFMLEKLSTTRLEKDSLYTELGRWVDNTISKKFTASYGTIKISESTPIEAYKLLCKKEDSPYYSSNDHSYFDIYNAFTDIICNDSGRDIVNKFEKVYLVSEILNIV